MNKKEYLIPGYYYHIYNRGNSKENIFYEEKNYEYFLQKYDKYIPGIADTYSYSLSKNHFNLVVKIKEEKELPDNYRSDYKRISLPFSHLFNSYAKSINKMYGRTGSLFQERFKREVITSNNYLMEVILYIHLKSQKQGIAVDFKNYPYSSYYSILSAEKTNLSRDEVLKLFGSKENFILQHEEMRNRPHRF